MKYVIVNAITAVRVVLSVCGGYAAFTAEWRVACVCFAAAALSDVIDGRLARGLQAQTKRGAVFDSSADIVLSVSIIVGLIAGGVWPWWILAIIVPGIAVFTVVSTRPPLHGVAGWVQRIQPWFHPLAAIAILLTALGWYVWLGWHESFYGWLMMVLYAGTVLVVGYLDRRRFMSFLPQR